MMLNILSFRVVFKILDVELSMYLMDIFIGSFHQGTFRAMDNTPALLGVLKAPLCVAALTAPGAGV